MSLFRRLNGKDAIKIIRGYQNKSPRVVMSIHLDGSSNYSKSFASRHTVSILGVNQYPISFDKTFSTNSCFSTVKKFDNRNAVYVGGSNFEQYDKESFKYLFQQFGPIEDVQIRPPGNTKSSYGFAFVIFSDEDSAEKACLVKRLETPHGSLHVKRKTSSVKNEVERTYVIHGCAHTIPIRKVYEYLNSLSEVELINRGRQGNNLYVVFRKECDHLLNELMELNGLILTMERAIPGTKRQRRDRCLKVKLLGVPTSFSEMTVRNYFEKFGPLHGVYFETDRSGKRNEFCYLNFTKQEDAHAASHNYKHEIDGVVIKAVSQGAVYT